MANGFTNLPTSLLGAVNIGGALTVGGGLTVGASPNIVRVGNFTGYGPGISGNLAFDAATRDNAGVTAALEALGANGNAPKRRTLNAAGTALDRAIADFYGTSFAQLLSTADTAEHTVYTKTLPAGLLGANGSVAIEIAWTLTALTSTSCTLRVKFGGTTIATHSMTAVQVGYLRVFLANMGATNVQRAFALTLNAAAAGAVGGVAGAIDTTANADITVTLQNGTASNTCEVDLIAIKDGNSFGPV